MWLFQPKIRICESGVLEGINDCHTHILPGVDDGVNDIDESLEILSLMENAGFESVWLTPHVCERFQNESEFLKMRFDELMKTYRGNLSVRLASENKIDALFVNRLRNRDFLVQEDALLLETSFAGAPVNLMNIFRDIKDCGLRVIYAHPERYHYFSQNDLIEIKESGVEFQLNLSSLLGMYGIEAMQNSRWMLEKGVYDHLGTDTHSLSSFKFLLSAKISPRYINLLNSIK